MAKQPAAKRPSKPAKKSSTKKPAPARTSGKTKPAADAQRRMHDFVRDTMASHRLDIDSVRTMTTETFTSLGEGLRHAMPADRSNILHQTFHGLVEAFTASADSARLAIEHAKAAGRRVSREDLAEFAASMKSIEKHFLDAVADAASGMSKEAKAGLEELVKRAKKAGTSIGRVAFEAGGTAAHNAPEFAMEAAKASGRAAAALASEFALGVSGLLSGIGDALRTTSKAKAPAKKTPSKRASGSKRSV